MTVYLVRMYGGLEALLPDLEWTTYPGGTDDDALMADELRRMLTNEPFPLLRPERQVAVSVSLSARAGSVRCDDVLVGEFTLMEA